MPPPGSRGNADEDYEEFGGDSSGLPNLSPIEQAKLIEDNKMLRKALEESQKPKTGRMMERAPIIEKVPESTIITLDCKKIKIGEVVREFNSAQKGKQNKIKLTVKGGEVVEFKAIME